MQKYSHQEIENKWKDCWYKNNVYKAIDFSEKPKRYILAEYPYPSGNTLHIGHAMRYTVPEIYSRFLRMKGFNVMFPMGWDAFGLPTEEHALRENKTPQEVVEQLCTSYKKAMQDFGYAIDWDREFSTTDPAYYKWTQWLFLKFYENGLAELKEMPVWWCEELGNLADEEVLTDKDGNKISERGSYKVERKMYQQWVLKIPAYAEKLLEGLKEVDYFEHIKIAQQNWIGKSEGASMIFDVMGEKLEVFTTRPDTIYGITFIALSPEHSLIEKLANKVTNKVAVDEYIQKAKNLSDLERQTKEKTGVKLQGIFAKHPFEEVKREIPVFVADYVLMDYATGAIMAVPGHDERDLIFAQKYGLEVIKVINKDNKMVNSDKYNGMDAKEFWKESIKRLETENKGGSKTIYKIRDWVFSRQRYWGEPIPIIYTEDGKTEAISYDKLPVELPSKKDLLDWVNTTDSKGKPAKRETQTMPNWAGSSWYYLRYTDPKNDQEFADPKKLKYWLPVDKYFGGAEHTTLHLLYSRFWHRFFYDIGLVPTEEPYQWRMNGGLLLGPDGSKMSKSKGNVVEVDKLLAKFGADASRLALCFLGPYTDTFPWSDTNIKSMYKFLSTIYLLKDRVVDKFEDKETTKAYHKMVKNITEMADALKMNTAISQLMIFVNELKLKDQIDKEIWKGFIKCLAPFAPFLAEELWQEINGYKEWKNENSVHLSAWPKYNENLIKEDKIIIPVQINGKVRGEIEIKGDETEEEVKALALSNERLVQYTQGKEIKKLIFIPNRILSLLIVG